MAAKVGLLEGKYCKQSIIKLLREDCILPHLKLLSNGGICCNAVLALCSMTHYAMTIGVAVVSVSVQMLEFVVMLGWGLSTISAHSD